MVTDVGDKLNILSTGYRNLDAGPDFLEGKINLRDIEWSGQIEIHIRASDWIRHGHQSDHAYDNVILHVVWENDFQVFRKDGSPIPTLSLANRVDAKIMDRYRGFNNSLKIHCQNSLQEIPEITKWNMVDFAAIERLKYKSEAIRKILVATQNHWEITALRFLLVSLAFNKNKESFHLLSKSIPWIQWLKLPLFQKEAIVFGQAGMLSEPVDNYMKKLKKEYHFLKYKWGINSCLEPLNWKYLRIRPSNFPDLKLAQFCSIVHQTQGSIFSKIKNASSINELKDWLNVTPSNYWKKHFRLGSPSSGNPGNMGKSTVNKLIINCMVSLLFEYSQSMDNEIYLHKAIDLLEKIGPESNKIIDTWKQHDLKPENSWQSQGLIHLYNLYCEKKGCLNCKIGQNILIKTCY